VKEVKELKNKQEVWMINAVFNNAKKRDVKASFLTLNLGEKIR
jgi:hypothetical protein